MNQVRIVIFIQFLNSFINGILAVTLPLMMKERNISIVTIGFVFASMPMIFQLGRMFFATVSDFWGRKLFFVLNGFLAVISSSIYYLAHTPLEFLFGKVMEGTKDGSLWAVNRAFLLEKSEKKWATLVNLRTAAFVSYAVGSLIAGFLIVWFFYEGTLILCVLVGAFLIPLAFLLFGGRRKKFTVDKALHLLDFRKKTKIFQIFLVLFLIMGLSLGFRSGFVFPLFLSGNGFDIETIGVLLGLQILLAGLFSYLFAKRVKIKKLILTSGLLYTAILIPLGFSGPVFAGTLVVAYGMVEGLLGIIQERILSRIAGRESYGTDIGLLWMGFHGGETLSLAISGLVISTWGFAASFLMSASIFPFFFVTTCYVMKG